MSTTTPEASALEHPDAQAADPQAVGPDAQPTLTELVESVLITSGRALAIQKLTEAVSAAASGFEQGLALPDQGSKPETIDPAGVRAALDQLNAVYASTGRVFRILEVSGGWRLMTLPRFAPAIASLQAAGSSTRLSRAAIETLAIIAYRQPVTRAHVDAIRGVATGEVMRTLTERGLITITGRAEDLGRPLLYGTTKRFLEMFGLRSIKDLPSTEHDGLVQTELADPPEPEAESKPEPKPEPRPEQSSGADG